MSTRFIFVMKQTSGSTSVLLFVFFVSRMILLWKMSSPHKDVVLRNILLEGLALFFVEGIYCFSIQLSSLLRAINVELAKN